MSDVEILHYEPSFKEELAAFRGRTYQGQFPEAGLYLEWKYEHNPYIAAPIFYIARAEGRIVGMRGVFGTRWEYGDARDTVVLPCADDFAVDPAYRNRGIMSLIMREAAADLARRGYEYVINTGAGRVTATSSLAAGWRSAMPMEPVVRRSPGAQVRHRVKTRVRAMRGAWRFVRDATTDIPSTTRPFRRLDGMGRLPARNAGAFLVAESEPRSEAMAALVARLPCHGRIRHVRDATYFAWRYRSPIRQYRFLYYERNGVVEGYLVLVRYPEYQLPTLPFQLVDFEGADDGVREELIRCAITVSRVGELGAWSGGLPPAHRDLLTRAGFVPTNLDLRKRGLPCVLVKRLQSNVPPAMWTLGGASILDPQRWDMRLIYSMHG